MKTKLLRPGIFLAAGSFLLGILIYVFLVGYSFSAYICFGIGGLLICYELLTLLAKKHRRAAKILRIILTCCVCVGLAAAAVTGILIIKAAAGTPDTACDYVIVLGAGVNGTEPSLTLRERIDAAYNYLTAHPDAVCIVSGGQGNGESITEAACMYRELTEMGIAPERIWQEDKATNTRENLAYSLDLIDRNTGTRPTRIGLVSSEYHLYRAGLFAREQGLDACGIPAKTSWFSLRLNYYLREIVAVWYYSLLR